MSCPAHIQLIAEEAAEEVAKEADVEPRLSRKQVAQKNARVKVGGGVAN